MNSRPRFKALALLAIVFSLFFAFLPLIQSVPPVLQETIIVDISGNGDFTSIQDAINNSKSGDIIILQKGEYFENNLNVNRMISIVGQGPADTIIDCSGNPGFILDSPSVDISGFKIINTEEYAIYVSPNSIKCSLSNIYIDGPKDLGIWIRASNTKISDCDMRGYSKSDGIAVKLRESNSVISNCNIQGFGVGILILVNSDYHKISNCNLFGNGEAVNIRIDSDNNEITQCNIYANDLGVNVRQKSINNDIHLNNFWKNEIDAMAEDNNTWDNGVEGNYWEQYTGIDTDGDGIGDTPYTISEGNTDSFPLTSIIFPDEITMPAALEHVTPSWDNTPSFSWSSSVYGKGVKGYYVRIDGETETYVGDTTSWTSPQSISDGVHTFYVRATGTDDIMSGYATISFSIDVTFIDTDRDGWSDDEEQQYGTDPYNPDNFPLDTDNDRITDSTDMDDDNDGYSDNMEISYGTDTKKSNSYPVDLDNDGIPDENSQDGKYEGDTDDDDDGLTDTIESNLGSDPKNGLDAKKIYIAGEPYHLVDVSKDNIYEILYNPEESSTTAVEKQDDNYLIDVNGDGSWDYIYNTIDGSVSAYEGQITLELTWLFAILGIIISVLVIFFYYTRIKPRRIKIFRKPLKITTKPSKIYIEDSDTVGMVSQTKNLLQSIQNDVTIYMDKLSQIEKQMAAASTKKEEESTPLPEEEVISLSEEKEEPPEEKIEPTVEDKPGDLESKVDELLARLEKKEDTD